MKSLLLAVLLLTGCTSPVQAASTEDSLTALVGHAYVIDHQSAQASWEYNYDKPIIRLSQLTNGDIQLVPTAAGTTDVRLERPDGSVVYTLHVVVQNK